MASPLGVTALLKVLSGELRRGAAGRLMQRVLSEHPEASIGEVMQLFRDAALDDQAVFEEVVTLALRRDPPKPQKDSRSSVLPFFKRQRIS